MKNPHITRHQLCVSDPQAATPAARPADCKRLIQFNNRNRSRCSRFYKHFYNDEAKRLYAVTHKEFARRDAKPAEPASALSYQCLTRRKLQLAAQAPASLGNVARELTGLWRADTNLEPRSARTLWCRGPPIKPRHQNRSSCVVRRSPMPSITQRFKMKFSPIAQPDSQLMYAMRWFGGSASPLRQYPRSLQARAHYSRLSLRVRRLSSRRST